MGLHNTVISLQSIVSRFQIHSKELKRERLPKGEGVVHRGLEPITWTGRIQKILRTVIQSFESKFAVLNSSLIFLLIDASEPRGPCAPNIFKIAQPKAKILIFVNWPNLDLCLQDRKRHFTVFTAKYDS